MRKKKAKSKPKAKASSPSKFWPGLLLGGAIAAAAVHFGPGWFKDEKQMPEKTTKEPPGLPKGKSAGTAREHGPSPAILTSPPQAPSPARGNAATQPQVPPPVPKAPGGLPFFRDPARAAYLLTRLEMGESYPGSLLWKKADALGWNAFGVLAIPGSSLVSTAGTAGNTVTCLLESKRADQVEALRLTANVVSPKGEEATISRFKSLAQAVLNETRCPVTREFLDAIGRSRGLQTESSEARFTLVQTPFAQGTRWELVVESR